MMNSLLVVHNFFNSIRFQIREALMSLIITLLLSSIIAVIYSRKSSKKDSNDNMFFTLIFISMVVCSTMLVIGNNLAGAFGLIGAVSIIRFRTTVKNPQDTTFILFVMAIGVACGFKYYVIAFVSTIFICSVIVIFQKINPIKNLITASSYILKLSINNWDGKLYFENYLKQDKVIKWDIKEFRVDNEDRYIIEYKITLNNNLSVKDFIEYLITEPKEDFKLLELKNA